MKANDIISVLAAVAAFVPSVALAGHRVVIDDTGASIMTQDCAPYGACGGFSTGFDLNIGGSVSDMIYTYTGGVVSLGATLPSATPLSITSLSQLEGTVITPGQQSQSLFGSLFYSAPGLARITYFMDARSASPDPAQPGSFPLYAYGGAQITFMDDSAITHHDGDFTVEISNNFTHVRGYQSGGTTLDFTALGHAVSGLEGIKGTGILSETAIGAAGPVDETFTFRNGVLVAPVPEPATWTLEISGFALVGGLLRSRRQHRTVTREWLRDGLPRPRNPHRVAAASQI